MTEQYTVPDIDKARVIQVIETTIARRGKGVNENPIRIITQYWSLDGQLLAEVDPYKEDKHIPEALRTENSK